MACRFKHQKGAAFTHDKTATLLVERPADGAALPFVGTGQGANAIEGHQRGEVTHGFGGADDGDIQQPGTDLLHGAADHHSAGGAGFAACAMVGWPAEAAANGQRRLILLLVEIVGAAVAGVQQRVQIQLLVTAVEHLGQRGQMLLIEGVLVAGNKNGCPAAGINSGDSRLLGGQGCRRQRQLGLASPIRIRGADQRSDLRPGVVVNVDTPGVGKAQGGECGVSADQRFAGREAGKQRVCADCAGADGADASNDH